jgi:hypothetical protein
MTIEFGGSAFLIAFYALYTVIFVGAAPGI